MRRIFSPVGLSSLFMVGVFFDVIQVISLCPDATMLESLRECNKLLEQVSLVKVW